MGAWLGFTHQLSLGFAGFCDKLWDMFYSGGMSNPLAAIEQISYLIFMKRLEDMDNQQRKAAERRGQKYTKKLRGSFLYN